MFVTSTDNLFWGGMFLYSMGMLLDFCTSFKASAKAGWKVFFVIVVGILVNLSVITFSIIGWTKTINMNSYGWLFYALIIIIQYNLLFYIGSFFVYIIKYYRANSYTYNKREWFRFTDNSINRNQGPKR